MRNLLAALALIALCAGPSAAADVRQEVMASVNRFVEGFNKGDVEAALAVYTDDMVILDEFPPHVWQGAGAGAAWFHDYDADAKQKAITDGVVTLAKARHIDVDGDHAYVVVPANYLFKKQGKPVKEIGSVLTLSLQKGEAGWKLNGWAWAKN